MEMQANKKLVQQHVKKITGRKITLKDLHNIDKKRTVSLPEIVHELREMNGGYCCSIENIVNIFISKFVPFSLTLTFHHFEVAIKWKESH